MQTQRWQAIIPLIAGILLVMLVITALQPVQHTQPPSVVVISQPTVPPTIEKIASTPTSTSIRPPLAGRIVASCCMTNVIMVIKAHTGERNPIITTTLDQVNHAPTWSPAGGLIAFVSNRDGNLEIYLTNADATAPRNLSNTTANDYAPTWSPDGSQLAFVSERDGNAEIYVMNADGTAPRNLSNNTENDYAPTWSPDGSQLAFVSERDGNADIYVMNADGAMPRNLSQSPAQERGSAWSPDGTQLVWSVESGATLGLMLAQTDGTASLQLTSGWADARPVWSPDGTVIAFERILPDDETSHIALISPNGDAFQIITEQWGDHAVWSPDSQYLVFSNAHFGLRVVKRDGTGLLQLTRTPDVAAQWTR